MRLHARTLAALCGIVTLAAAPRAADAQRLATRADLLSALGGTARTETFDRLTEGGTNIVALGATPTLDASTVFPGRGAGLIEPGIALGNQNNGHWFYPASYAWFGNPTGVYAGGHTVMDLAFTAPTRAFGVDLWVFWSAGIAATVSVYDLAGELVSASTLPPSPTQFFGWQHDAGISRVRFSGGTNDALSVRLDDLTFGPGTATVTPEPATLGLVGAGLALGGLARRRRRTRG
jgi:hypothetical protein